MWAAPRPCTTPSACRSTTAGARAQPRAPRAAPWRQVFAAVAAAAAAAARCRAPAAGPAAAARLLALHRAAADGRSPPSADRRRLAAAACLRTARSPDGSRAEIYLKREDLNHTGAHKINNSLGQALLCKRMGKKRIIAETGAGQHGVATVRRRRRACRWEPPWLGAASAGSRPAGQAWAWPAGGKRLCGAPLHHPLRRRRRRRGCGHRRPRCARARGWSA